MKTAPADAASAVTPATAKPPDYADRLADYIKANPHMIEKLTPEARSLIEPKVDLGALQKLTLAQTPEERSGVIKAPPEPGIVAKAMPTAGAIAGSVVGGALGGAAAGPPGAAGGGIIGAGVGGAIGQSAQDYVMGYRGGMPMLERALERGVGDVALQTMGAGTARAAAEAFPAASAAVVAAVKRFPKLSPLAGRGTGSKFLTNIEELPGKMILGAGRLVKFASDYADEALQTVKGFATELGSTQGTTLEVMPKAADALFSAANAARRAAGAKVGAVIQQSPDTLVSIQPVLDTIERVRGFLPLGAPSAVGKTATAMVPPETRAAEGLVGKLAEQVPGMSASAAQRVAGKVGAGQAQIAAGLTSKIPKTTLEAAQRLHEMGLIPDEILDAVQKRGQLELYKLQAVKVMLGDLAYAGTSDAAPTANQGAVRMLYGAVSRTIDQAMATHPELAGMRSQYQAANAAYQKIINVIEDGVNRALRRDPETFVKAVFDPSRSPETLQMLREGLNQMGPQGQKIYGHMLTTWFAGGIQKAMTGPADAQIFNPGEFAKFLQPYITSGAIDRMLPTQGAESVRAMETLFARSPQVPVGPGWLGTWMTFMMIGSPVAFAMGQKVIGATGMAAVGGASQIAKTMTNPRVVRFLMTGPGASAYTKPAITASAQIVGNLFLDEMVTEPEMPKVTGKGSTALK